MNILFFVTTFWFVSVMAVSFATNLLSNLNLLKKDYGSFYEIYIDLDLEDTALANIIDLTSRSEFLVTTGNQTKCAEYFGQALKITDINSILDKNTTFKSRAPYIKDCVTYLVNFETENDLNEILAKGSQLLEKQPYFYAIKKKFPDLFELYEVQMYAIKIILISTWNSTNKSLTTFNGDLFERRSDFNGATVRISFPDYMPDYGFDSEF